MKKIFYALMSIAVVAFVGCDKGSEGDGETLTGTKWKYSDATMIATMEFTSDTSFKASSVSLTDSEVWEDTGTYTYNPPTVVMTIDGEPMTATISGNKMTAEDGGRVFTKM